MELGTLLLERSNKKIYLSKDKKFLIKVFNHNLVKQDEVLQEAVMQSRAEQFELINVPSVEEVFKVGKDWAIASRYIQGDTLEDLLNKDPSSIKEILTQFVKLQTKLNSIKASKFESIHSLAEQRIKVLKNDIDASSRYELHARLESFAKMENLCHLDFNLSNVVVASDGEVGKLYVIDWAHARKGNPVSDVALTYLNFILEDKKDIAETYLSLYLKNSDVAKQDVIHFLPLVAAYKLSRGGLSTDQINYLKALTNVAEY